MEREFEYVCSKCGKKYYYIKRLVTSWTKYRNALEKIANGEYGAEWKRIHDSTPYVAFDSRISTYFCDSCGDWIREMDLSLYEPNDHEDIQTKYYSDKTIGQLGYVPYATSSDLEYDFRLIKEYEHKCHNCGSIMRKISNEETDNLPCPCPVCKTKNLKTREHLVSVFYL